MDNMRSTNAFSSLGGFLWSKSLDFIVSPFLIMDKCAKGTRSVCLKLEGAVN